MSKTITRTPLLLFGGSGLATNFAQFGSQLAGAPLKTKDIAMIQALSAWVNGWQNAVATGNTPYLEDLNAVFYVLAYMQSYLLQEGVPEYDATTDYFVGSIVKHPGSSELYVSMTDANVGQALPASGSSDFSWHFLCGLVDGAFRIGGHLSMNSQKIMGLAPATNPDDAVRLDQLSAAIAGVVVGGIPEINSVNGTGALTPDATLQKTLLISLTGDVVMNGPSGGVDGQKMTFRFIQDSTGHAVAFSAGDGNFRFGLDIPSFTPSGINLTDYVGVIFNAGSNVWDVVSVIQGF